MSDGPMITLDLTRHVRTSISLLVFTYRSSSVVELMHNCWRAFGVMKAKGIWRARRVRDCDWERYSQSLSKLSMFLESAESGTIRSDKVFRLEFPVRDLIHEHRVATSERDCTSTP